MKRSILRAFALCITTAFLAGQASAQDDTDKSKSRTDSPGSPTPGGPGATSAYSAGPAPNAYPTRAGLPARLSKLMNAGLRGKTGEALGQIHEILIEPGSGQIQFVVLSISDASAGATGASTSPSTETSVSSPRSAPSAVGSYGTVTGGRLVAVPWRLISSSGSDQYTASIDKARLQSAPAFSSTTWPIMDSAWSHRVYSHFGVDAPVSGSRTSAAGAPGSDTGTGTGASPVPGSGPGNPATPGVPSLPGTPDITPPSPAATPGTSPNTLPGTVPSATGTGGK